MRLVGALLLCLVFGACTTTYSHATKSNQDFNHDYAHCAAEAGQACGHGQESGYCKSNMVDTCLKGEGWYVTGH